MKFIGTVSVNTEVEIAAAAGTGNMNRINSFDMYNASDTRQEFEFRNGASGAVLYAGSLPVSGSPAIREFLAWNRTDPPKTSTNTKLILKLSVNAKDVVVNVDYSVERIA